ncbi:MAG: protein translocase subunit SecF, partial [bacterium]
MKQFQIIRPGTNINFLGARRRFGILSGTLILATVVILIVNVFVRGTALNYGIDFRGGTQVQIEFQNKPGLDTAAVRDALTKLNYRRLEVIKAGTEGNAYVVRMENPKIIGQPAKGKDLKTVLEQRFLRTTIRLELPSKDAAKHSEIIAALETLGVKGARAVPLLVPTKKPVVRILAASTLSLQTTNKLKAALQSQFKSQVRTENVQIMRRFKPAKAGDQIRLAFSEDVSESEVREAFAEAKVDIAPTAGSVARRGRQEKHKVKWVVRLVGLSDKLTRQLNQNLSRFVKSTGVLQNLRFGLNIPPEDKPLKAALRAAGFGKSQPYALRITFTHKEKRKPSDVRKELISGGLALKQGSAVTRVGDPSNRRWAADVAFQTYTPVATLNKAVSTLGGKLERIAVRLSEQRYRNAIRAAGYTVEDALILRVFFKMKRSLTPAEMKKAIRAQKLPIAKHRDTLARVGESQENMWLLVLDVHGKDSGLEIERKLATIGSVGITALEIPPHGAVKSIQSVVRVGSKVGNKLRIDGILSVLYTLGLILLYIGLRFDLKFAPGAVLALAHDVFITVGIWAVFWLEFNLSTIAALLTIVGYSLNDTIVVFDRIRENLSRLRDAKLSKVINTSLNETLSRTLLTSLTTLAAIVAILFLATGDLWIFALALTIGILIGTYSSIFIASPAVLVLDDWLAKRSTTARVTRDSGDGGGGGGGGAGGSGSRTRRESQTRAQTQTDGQLSGA